MVNISFYFMLLMLIYWAETYVLHILRMLCIKKNSDALVVYSNLIVLDINADETQYMVISRDKNAG
jgi:hypothetical protein